MTKKSNKPNEKKVIERQKSKQVEASSIENAESDSPSALVSVFVIAVVMVLSIASATISAAILRDLFMTVAVFIFTLLILTIVVPYLLLSTGQLNQANWLRTYVLVLKKIPGLDMVLESFLKFGKK